MRSEDPEEWTDEDSIEWANSLQGRFIEASSLIESSMGEAPFFEISLQTGIAEDVLRKIQDDQNFDPPHSVGNKLLEWCEATERKYDIGLGMDCGHLLNVITHAGYNDERGNYSVYRCPECGFVQTCWYPPEAVEAMEQARIDLMNERKNVRDPIPTE